MTWREENNDNDVTISPAMLARQARNIMLEQLRPELVPITRKLIDKAKKGDVLAARELFDRTLGKAQQFIDVTSDGKQLPRPILSMILEPNTQTLPTTQTTGLSPQEAIFPPSVPLPTNESHKPQS